MRRVSVSTARWSRHTHDCTPAPAVTLNPERKVETGDDQAPKDSDVPGNELGPAEHPVLSVMQGLG